MREARLADYADATCRAAAGALTEKGYEALRDFVGSLRSMSRGDG